jgi:hypothetical protein
MIAARPPAVGRFHVFTTAEPTFRTSRIEAWNHASGPSSEAAADAPTTACRAEPLEQDDGDGGADEDGVRARQDGQAEQQPGSGEGEQPVAVEETEGDRRKPRRKHVVVVDEGALDDAGEQDQRRQHEPPARARPSPGEEGRASQKRREAGPHHQAQREVAADAETHEAGDREHRTELGQTVIFGIERL